MAVDITSRIEIAVPLKSPDHLALLSREAISFIADLSSEFSARVEALLAARRTRQMGFDRGDRPDFMASTLGVRTAEWVVAPLPKDLHQRKVEITGPVERKMIINALNSGADVFMADFEDSSSPTWSNMLEGQINLRDAVRGTIRHLAPDAHKVYELRGETATLMVRPRGLHLLEKHVCSRGRPIPAALFDFGLFFFHNARALLERGSGPYFYLPKMESHLEARLWNDIFNFAEAALEIPRGTIKATALIETLPAAFEMDEILFELKEHSAGLNCGRWDYIFSAIKTLRRDPTFVLPDRGQVTMTQHFLRAYTQLLIRTCHRRHAHAIGGMAAQIPIKNDPIANESALDKVRADKLREVTDGHDGTWVAHPGLVPLAKEVFEAGMSGPHQLDKKREDVHVTQEDLLRVPEGTRTEAGVRQNVAVGVMYLEAWLRGLGCVPIDHLMEDAATAEISRAQLWQWVHHSASLDEGRPITVELFGEVLARELASMQAPEHNRLPEAAALFTRLVTQETFEEFLTVPAYELLLDGERDERPDQGG